MNSFTPCFDDVTKVYGVAGSAVYGRIWRYCQMESGTCTASQSTIAKELQMSRRTVMRHIKKLIDDGLVMDMTPEDKDGISLTLRVTNCHRLPVTKSHTTCDNLSHKDSLYQSQDDEIGEIDNTTPFQKLNIAFMNITKITNFGNDPKWVKAINEMVNAEIEVEDLEAGIEYLRSNNYTISGPWSVKRSASVARSKRIQKPIEVNPPVASEVY